MLLKLFFLFIVLPLIELTLLLMLADLTSVWFTLVVVIVTGVVGSLLARSQGWRTYRRIHAELAQGRLPAASLLDAVLIFFAGALLLTPGVLTDAFGLSLLIPSCRRLYRTWLVQWFHARFELRSFTAESNSARRSEVIDSFVVDRSGENDSGNR